MTRDEYLDWAKRRALRFLEHGDCTGAMRAVLSDLSKHPELKDDQRFAIGNMWWKAPGMRQDADFVRRFIAGFR